MHMKYHGADGEAQDGSHKEWSDLNGAESSPGEQPPPSGCSLFPQEIGLHIE
jgi:hypothetical protein